MDNRRKKKKRSKWVKLRHRIVIFIVGLLIGWYIRLKYHVKIEKCKELKKRQFFLISNHQTAFDQFFPSLAVFPQHIYYIASEDLFSNGFLSKLIKFLVAPIPFMKSTSDASAVLNCLRVAREGGSIGVFAEGNRSYHGRLGYIKPSVASLAKAMRIPIALFRIEGGYGVHPRWSDVVRHGKMRAYVSRIIEPEEYKDLSDEELFDIIIKEINVNEAQVNGEFYHKKNAEYLERVMYICDTCGFSTFESHRDIIACKKCGKQIKHLPTKELVGVNCDFPFRFVADWFDYQCNFINNINPRDYSDEPLYCDTARLVEVIPSKRKLTLAREASISLYGNKIIVKHKSNEWAFDFENVTSMTVLGKNKLDIYFGEKTYQLKGDKRFNAMKYMNLYFRYAHVCREVKNEHFLGI